MGGSKGYLLVSDRAERTYVAKAPKLVRDVYRQSLDALKNQSNVLAGIGLRATIEAICNHQKVVGKNLEVRIDKLAKAGLISQSDADRLHAIRFLGNDAAHDIAPAEMDSLLVALRIVEHLIISLYVLDEDADGVLETLIKSYTEFEKLLAKKLDGVAAGLEQPLFKYLGKDIRRFHGYLKTHETQLVSNIASGSFALLAIGKMDSFAGSKEKFQYYIKT